MTDCSLTLLLPTVPFGQFFNIQVLTTYIIIIIIRVHHVQKYTRAILPPMPPLYMYIRMYYLNCPGRVCMYVYVCVCVCVCCGCLVAKGYPYSNVILPYEYVKFTFLLHVSSVVHLNYGTCTASCTASCTVCTAVLLFKAAIDSVTHWSCSPLPWCL